MKKIILPIVLFVLVSFTVVTIKLTDAEREMAVKELTHSQDEMLYALDGLSEAQLYYKPDAETWSLVEITEHLAITENMIFGMLQESLKTPADPSRRGEVKMSDEQILGLIEDRTNKVKTQIPMEPTGKFGDFESTLKMFTDSRRDHIDYVKKTDDDLRNHYAQFPFGTVDGFQVILFMSGHTDRHVKQMHELMSGADFPEK